MTVAEAATEKNLNNFESIQYFSILKCLTNRLKNLINSAESSIQTPEHQIKLSLQRENSKIVYWNLIKSKKVKPSSEEKIINKFNKHLTDTEWNQIYSIPFSCTIEVKLRSFQFSINHLYYFSNDKLHRIGKSQTPNCTFCKTEIETVTHIFLYCPHVLSLWDYFEHIFIRLRGHISDINDLTKLIGFYKEIENKDYNIINHILIVLKHFLHICRLKETQPSVAGFKARILDTEYLERQIATRKHKLECHTYKWEHLLNIIHF